MTSIARGQSPTILRDNQNGSVTVSSVVGTQALQIDAGGVIELEGILDGSNTSSLGGHSLKSLTTLAAFHNMSNGDKPVTWLTCFCTDPHQQPNLTHLTETLKAIQRDPNNNLPPGRICIPIGGPGHMMGMILDFKGPNQVEALWHNSLNGYQVDKVKTIQAIQASGLNIVTPVLENKYKYQDLSRGDLRCGDWTAWYFGVCDNMSLSLSQLSSVSLPSTIDSLHFINGERDKNIGKIKKLIQVCKNNLTINRGETQQTTQTSPTDVAPPSVAQVSSSFEPLLLDVNPPSLVAKSDHYELLGCTYEHSAKDFHMFWASLYAQVENNYVGLNITGDDAISYNPNLPCHFVVSNHLGQNVVFNFNHDNKRIEISGTNPDFTAELALMVANSYAQEGIEVVNKDAMSTNFLYQKAASMPSIQLNGLPPAPVIMNDNSPQAQPPTYNMATPLKIKTPPPPPTYQAPGTFMEFSYAHNSHSQNSLGAMGNQSELAMNGGRIVFQGSPLSPSGFVKNYRELKNVSTTYDFSDTVNPGENLSFTMRLKSGEGHRTEVKVSRTNNGMVRFSTEQEYANSPKATIKAALTYAASEVNPVKLSEKLSVDQALKIMDAAYSINQEGGQVHLDIPQSLQMKIATTTLKPSQFKVFNNFSQVHLEQSQPNRYQP